MTTTIKLKNGTGVPTAGALVQGEPAFDLTNKRLYTENAGGTVIEVGTNPSTLSVTGAATVGSTLGVTGAAIFSSTVAGAFNGTLGATTPASVAATTGTFSGVVTANAGVVVDNITIDGSDIASTGSLFLDSDDAAIYMSDGGTDIGLFSLASQDLTIRNLVSDKDINFQGNDGGSNFTAFSLDMSAAGAATFNSNVTGVTFIASAGLYTNNGIIYGNEAGINLKDSGSRSIATFNDTGLGTSNVAMGVNAGNSIASGGNYNTVVGDEAGTAITTGDYNVALGYLALPADTLGSRSTAIGVAALEAQNFTSATDAYNTAVGFGAGAAVTTGTFNTLIGGLAGDGATTASYSTALGYGSLGGAMTGEGNVALGVNTLLVATSAHSNTAVGTSAMSSATTGINNVAVGRNALDANTTASNNTAVGYDSLGANTTASDNTSVGAGSMDATTTGAFNSALGSEALGANTTGASNVAVGVSALAANTTASNNTAVGRDALLANTTAANNTAVGYQAGYTNTTGTQNTYSGYWAGYLTTGSTNSFFGYGAGSSVTTGGKNTIIGAYNGNQGGLDIRTASNHIVLSDGDGNPRAYWDAAGAATFGGKLSIADAGSGTVAAFRIGAAQTGLSSILGTDLTFLNNGTTGMTLDASGNLLVGTSTNILASRKLQVQGVSGQDAAVIRTFGNVAAEACINLWNYTAVGDGLFISFGTEASFTSRGSVDYNRAGGLTRYNTTSDGNLKNIIGDAPVQKSLDILASVKLREYSWKDDPDNKPQIGPIAQELYETFKGAVSAGGDIEKTDDEGNVTTEYRPWGVDKTAFSFHLVAGHQHLMAENASLHSLVNALTARIEALEGAN
jgi:trimeric autotransporter adhesin